MPVKIIIIQRVLLLSVIMPFVMRADIHDRIERKVNRNQSLLEIVNQTTMDDLAIDQDILSTVTQILECTCSCMPEFISQEKIDQGGGTFTAGHSGDYCVIEDVVGTIVLGSHNACLDLGCHKLDAGGADVAIQVLGDDCSIRNGTVTGTSGATSKLISAISVNGLQVNNVHLIDFESFGFYGDTLRNFSVSNCNFRNGGEPIFITGSHIGQLDGHKIFGNVNRLPANNGMIELIGCESIEVRDVKICGNSKNYIAPQLNLTSSAFFIAESCNIISLHNMHVNNTQPNVPNPGSAVDVSLVGALFLECNSIVVQDSTLTTKSLVPDYNAAGMVFYFSDDIILDSVACIDVENISIISGIALGMVVVGSHDMAVYSSQFNRGASVGGFGALVVAGSSSIFFTACQFSATESGPTNGGGLAVLDSVDCVVANSTAYGNLDATIAFAGGSGNSVINFSGDARITLDNIQNSSLENVNLYDIANGSGFEISNAQGLVFKNCVVSGSTGNGFITFNTNSAIEFEDCVAQRCDGSGFSINDPVSSILLKSSQALSNGVFGFQIPANASNNTITNCVALNNGVSNYSIDVPAPLIFTVDDTGTIVGFSDYFHNLSRI